MDSCHAVATLFAPGFAAAGEATAGGVDGFLGSRASLAMDLVVVGMAVALPCLSWSISVVRRGRYVLHRRIQMVLSVVLLTAIVLFEIDVRLYGWQARAAGEVGHVSTAVWAALTVHLVFAISTAVLWPTVVVLAVRRFPRPPQPGDHSPTHRRWARIAAWDMGATAVSGWIFYWLAFVA